MERQTETKKRFSLRHWILFVLFAIGALGLAFAFDGAVYQWTEDHRVRSVREFMRAVSQWGDWPSHIVLGIVLAGFAYLRKQRHLVRLALVMILACAVGGAGVRVVKISTGRARPSVKSEQRWGGARFTQNYQSFPSGHAAATFGFFGALALWNWRLALLCLPIPLLIAFSRIYLQAHYFSDVVAGAIFGLLSALLVDRLLRRSLAKQAPQNAAD